MATRQEITNIRDLQFSQWIRKNLPDSSTGLMVSDLDFILCNYKHKKILLLEIKTRGAGLKTWQNKLFQNLARWLSNGMDNGYEFKGFHVLKFENTSFEDGRVFLNNKEITEKMFIDGISFLLGYNKDT